MSLFDSSNSSVSCEELEVLDILQHRPRDLGEEIGPSPPTSISEDQLPEVQVRIPMSKEAEKVFRTFEKPCFMYSGNTRKRAQDLDPQLSYLSQPSPNKRQKIESMERKRGRPRKEGISDGEDLRVVAKRIYARKYRENVSFPF